MLASAHATVEDDGASASAAAGERLHGGDAVVPGESGAGVREGILDAVDRIVLPEEARVREPAEEDGPVFVVRERPQEERLEGLRRFLRVQGEHGVRLEVPGEGVGIERREGDPAASGDRRGILEGQADLEDVLAEQSSCEAELPGWSVKEGVHGGVVGREEADNGVDVTVGLGAPRREIVGGAGGRGGRGHGRDGIAEGAWPGAPDPMCQGTASGRLGSARLTTLVR